MVATHVSGYTTLDMEKTDNICCISDSRGVAKEFGFAHLSLCDGTCRVGQFADTPSLPCLQRHVMLTKPDVVIIILTRKFLMAEDINK